MMKHARALGVWWFGVPNTLLLVQVALRFKPGDLRPTQLKLTCIFNNTALNSTTLLLTGVASEPQLSWDVPDGQLYFRPTCVGATSHRQVTVTNMSRVPVGWQWVLSKKLQEAVSVDPWVSGGVCHLPLLAALLLVCLLQQPACS